MKNFKIIRKSIQIIAFLPVTILLIKNISYFSLFLIILTALAGAFYCGYLCPFGFLQELSSIISDKLKIKKRIIPKNLDIALKSLRYILFLFITVLAIDAVFPLLKFDARSNLYLFLSGKNISNIMRLSVLVFLVLSLIYSKPFCKYLCIKGAGYGILSKLRVFSINRNTDTCIDCKLCDKVCPMGVNVSSKEHVDSMSCINCFDCIKVCPKKKTLTFGTIKTRQVKKKLVYASIAGVLVIGYLYKVPSNILNIPPLAKAESPKESSSAKDQAATAQPVVDNATYYIGEGEGYQGTIKVSVGIEDGKITKIDVTDHSEDFEWYSKAKNPIIDSVIETQSSDVDVVSGATYTSEGIINAISNALEQSK